jgi:hypothetical protein
MNKKMHEARHEFNAVLNGILETALGREGTLCTPSAPQMTAPYFLVCFPLWGSWARSGVPGSSSSS